MKVEMKIWIGPELEGYDKGKLTMFVKAKKILATPIIAELEKNPECWRLYLGAGRTDTEVHSVPLFNYCLKHEIEVVVETSTAGIKLLPEYALSSLKLIMRIDIPIAEQLAGRNYLKLDTGKNVKVIQFCDMVHTGLEDLEGDTFINDTVLVDTIYDC